MKLVELTEVVFESKEVARDFGNTPLEIPVDCERRFLTEMKFKKPVYYNVDQILKVKELVSYGIISTRGDEIVHSSGLKYSHLRITFVNGDEIVVQGTTAVLI